MSTEKKVKIGIIGYNKVGKSTLINDFISSSNENEDVKAGGNQIYYLAPENKNKIVFDRTIDEKKYKVYFYEFNYYDDKMLPFLQECMTVVLIFDLNNRESFDNLFEWFKFLKENYKGDNKKIYLYGNYKYGSTNLLTGQDEINDSMTFDKIDAEYIDIGIKNTEEKNKLLDNLIVTTYPRMNTNNTQKEDKSITNCSIY